MPPVTWVDATLLAEFEADAREGFARLLAALRPPASPEDARRAIQDLAGCLATARALAADGDLKSRFPLATDRTVRFVQTLVSAAAYGDPSPERYEKLIAMVARLGATAGAPLAAAG